MLYTAIVAALAAAGVTALLVTVVERKQEARNPFYRVVELTEETVDPATWSKNFPLQYDGYLRTVDQQRTRYAAVRRCHARPATPIRDRSWRTARRRPASEDDVGGLRLCHRLPRGARPRVHA